MCCSVKKARLRERRAGPRAYSSQMHPKEEKGPRSPRSGRGHRDASSRAFPRPLRRMWAVGTGAVLLGTGPGLARDAQAWGGIGRRREAAGGWGSEARLCAGGGCWTWERPPTPPTPGSPSFRKRAVPLFWRCCGVWARGRRRRGHPGGDPTPYPGLPAPPHPRELTACADPPRCTARPGSTPVPPLSRPRASTVPSLAGPCCLSPALRGAPAPVSARRAQAKEWAGRPCRSGRG